MSVGFDSVPFRDAFETQALLGLLLPLDGQVHSSSNPRSSWLDGPRCRIDVVVELQQQTQQGPLLRRITEHHGLEVHAHQLVKEHGFIDPG